MPQAHESQRKWAVKKFGSIDSGAIHKWLEERGFVNDSGYNWHRQKPPSKEENQAINFLIDEWDYGFYLQERE